MSLDSLQSAFQGYVIALDGRIALQIRSLPGASAAQRLEIYAEAYRLRLVEVLGHHYPALRGLLGDRPFDEMAVRYIDGHPSRHFSARWYGEELPAFLRTAAPFSGRPELAELADFEWALGRAFDAADGVPLRRNELAALPPDAWPGLRFTLQPALQRLVLRGNVVEIFKAVRAGESPPPVIAGEAQRWLVWRKGLECRFRPLDAIEARALEATQRGMAFAEVCELVALDADARDAPSRAAAFLERWIAEELIVGLEVTEG